jgi:3-phosphoshikimate 1-carboxyvinyltransferase
MPHAIRVQAPASKSFSHRYVFAAALAEGESVIRGVLDSNDLTRTMDCLAACGASFERSGGDVMVRGVGGMPQGGELSAPAGLYVADSGTTCRLVTGVVAAGRGAFRVHGTERMHERPIAALTEALSRSGVAFHWQGDPGYPPFVMETGGLPGGHMAVNASESSQYLSALMLAAPLAFRETVIECLGESIVSWPYVTLTMQVMEDFGLEFDVEVKQNGQFKAVPWREAPAPEPDGIRFIIPPGTYAPGEYAVEADWSNASYFCIAGALGPRPVTVMGVRPDSIQGDRAILNILTRMGARVDMGADFVTVSPGDLKGAVIDMGACPDLAPGVAVLASQAKGQTVIHGAAHLRIKECDRLAAPAAELAKIGCNAEVTDDGMRITPGESPAGKIVDFKTYDDHRMAMSLALLGLCGVDAHLDEPDVVAKSFPGFWDEWNKVVG